MKKVIIFITVAALLFSVSYLALGIKPRNTPEERCPELCSGCVGPKINTEYVQDYDRKLTAEGKTYYLSCPKGYSFSMTYDNKYETKIPCCKPVNNNGPSSPFDWVIVSDSKSDSSGPYYTEISKVGMVQANSDQAVATMWLEDSIPSSLPSYIGYVWPLDTDLNGDTGQVVHPNNIGSEYNLRVAYSPGDGWSAYIDDILRERAIRVKHFDVDYSRGIVSIVFPLDKISNPSDLRFMGSIAFRSSIPDFSNAKYKDFSY